MESGRVWWCRSDCRRHDYLAGSSSDPLHICGDTHRVLPLLLYRSSEITAAKRRGRGQRSCSRIGRPLCGGRPAAEQPSSGLPSAGDQGGRRTTWCAYLTLSCLSAATKIVCVPALESMLPLGTVFAHNACANVHVRPHACYRRSKPATVLYGLK